MVAPRFQPRQSEFRNARSLASGLTLTLYPLPDQFCSLSSFQPLLLQREQQGPERGGIAHSAGLGGPSPALLALQSAQKGRVTPRDRSQERASSRHAVCSSSLAVQVESPEGSKAKSK